MTLPCGCPEHVVVADPVRHAEWHAEIAPLKTAAAKELRETRGSKIPPERTFIDDQFDEARGTRRRGSDAE